MKVGMVGLGKLGLPVALAMEHAGHEVYGYDTDHEKIRMYAAGEYPHQELGPDGTGSVDLALKGSRFRDRLFYNMSALVEASDIVFVAVQTPHEPEYEGVTRMPDVRKDFEYGWLENAVEMLCRLDMRGKTLAIISTVLPGTIRERILPWVPPCVNLVHTPSFIAMGTTMRDWLNPEFVLVGSDGGDGAQAITDFYEEALPNVRILSVTIEEAELIKVLYNTYITSKIVFANTAMEICHKINNADVDVVTGALGLATTRLISPRYMRGGMGDGGGCHPRDNIALSYLAQCELGLSFDLFEILIRAREAQAEWLVEMMLEYDLPKFILGTAFKAESNIETGSPALLCAEMLKERGIPVALYDPRVPGRDEKPAPDEEGVFLIGAWHPEFAKMTFAAGSVVIDPWRMMPDQDGVIVIRVGAIR